MSVTTTDETDEIFKELTDETRAEVNETFRRVFGASVPVTEVTTKSGERVDFGERLRDAGYDA